jgi:glycine dehydrogenase subunit 2
MHINLHKTFSTPHGGGGPGSGPVVFSSRLAEFVPVPYLVRDADGLRLVEHKADAPRALGRLKGFHGQMGMFVRALTYLLSHGADGIRQASNDAVLNANYVMARLQDVMTPSFAGPCMHECLFDDRFLKDTGVTTLDFAKAMIDEGYHPMTMYFPLVVHGAMLIEPTESETKESLDLFVDTMRALVARAKAGEVAYFRAAPRLTPRRRLDETRAARAPVLRWKKPVAALPQAAE